LAILASTSATIGFTLSTPFWEFQASTACSMQRLPTGVNLSTPFWEFLIEMSKERKIRCSDILSTPFWEFRRGKKEMILLKKRYVIFLLPFGSFDPYTHSKYMYNATLLLSTPFWEFQVNNKLWSASDNYGGHKDFLLPFGSFIVGAISSLVTWYVTTFYSLLGVSLSNVYHHQLKHYNLCNVP